MLLEECGVRIIDSLNFIPMALAAMPKTFGEQELAKGFFPHFFNTVENASYVGSLPDVSMYGADARDVFLKWHSTETAKDTVFDMQRDLVRYCQSDVDILARCAMKYRDSFIKVSFYHFKFPTKPLLYFMAIFRRPLSIHSSPF